MEIEEKEIMKSEGDGKHPRSHYLVTTSDNVTDWHLRVRGMDGKPNHTLMGAAWAALHGGYRGNKYEGPNATEALSKLKKLYASENMPLPGSKTTLFKDKSGETWFLGIYSNNYEDRQGEFLTEAAHKEYVEWVNEKGIKPPVIVLHQPKFPDIVHIAHFIALASGKITSEEFNANLMKMYRPTAVAQTHAVMLKNGFVFVLGKVLPDKLEVASKLLERSFDWGMSHGFIPLIKRDNIIEQYRSFEFTLTPIKFAANELTAIGFSEVKMGDVLEGVPEEIKEMLSDEKLAESTETARGVLQGLLASKMESTMEDDEEKKKKEMSSEMEDEEMMKKKTEVEYATLRQTLFTDFKMEELATTLNVISEKLVAQESLINKQNAVIEMLTKTVVELQKTEDQKVAEKFMSPQWPTFDRKTQEPTADEKAQIEEIKKNLPEQIVEKTNKKTDNPLNTLFWGSLTNQQ